MTTSQKRKTGDLLCDTGKYLITVVPLTYVLSDKYDSIYVIVFSAFFGFLFVVFGLFFIRHSETKRTVSTGKVRKYKLLKNSVYTVEELKD